MFVHSNEFRSVYNLDQLTFVTEFFELSLDFGLRTAQDNRKLTFRTIDSVDGPLDYDVRSVITAKRIKRNADHGL
jgi:hypothetical protein